MCKLGHPDKVIPFSDKILDCLLPPAAPPEPGLSGGKAQGQSVLYGAGWWREESLTNKEAAVLIQGPIRWLHLNRQPITRQFCQEQFAIILLHFMEVKNSMKLQNSILDLETERQDCVNKPNKLFLNPINSFYRNKYPFEYKFVLIVNY